MKEVALHQSPITEFGGKCVVLSPIVPNFNCRLQSVKLCTSAGPFASSFTTISNGSLHRRDLKSREGLKLHYTKKSISASVQPLAQEVMEIKSSAEADVSGDSIRRRFLEFYASRGHKILPSSSLVPDDPTVLLTIAGMLQFKPIFLGKTPREVPRAATAQKCIRTNDVENVGRTARHHTFFEMLGNFSFGDYFKKEAIKWAWELSTSEFGLPADRVWISVYEDDDEAYAIWHDEVKMSSNNGGDASERLLSTESQAPITTQAQMPIETETGEVEATTVPCYALLCYSEDIAELEKFDEELMKSFLNQGKMVIE